MFGEINPCSQFHQYFPSSFCNEILLPKKSKLRNSILYEKDAHTILVKLTYGAHFINVLLTAFTPVAPQSVRTQSSCQNLFTLLGSTHIKAVHRTLMKSTPGVDFTNLCEPSKKLWTHSVWQ